MTSSKQGAKAARREKHLARQAALKERKALRLKRAAIHSAMGEAARMKRSKRKGTRDFDENMRGLGYGRIGDGPDVLDKFAPPNWP